MASCADPRRWGLLAIVAVVAWPAQGHAAPPGQRPSTDEPINDIVVYQLTSDWAWGYHCGVKQPLGAFKDGLSIHQFDKSNLYAPGWPVPANPDYILWVDEVTGLHGIAERPTGTFDGDVVNPGGMVSFDAAGRIWYTYGGRAAYLPLDLYVSDAPYDLGSFTVQLDDYVTDGDSTTPCVHVNDSKVMLFWRCSCSGSISGKVRMRRYDMDQGFQIYELQRNIGQGCVHDLLGNIGIEQLYTRFDARFGYLLLTWQWRDADTGVIGSNPFVFSTDRGTTWRAADWQPVNLPITYNGANEVLMPYDHLALGEQAGWQVRDVGVAPNGRFWMTLPEGDVQTNDGWKVNFWLFTGEDWEATTLTEGMPESTKPHACGVTDRYVVFVYSDMTARNVLRVRISSDSGQTWGEPVVLDVVPASSALCWASFVQPADRYVDDCVRFFYGYYRFCDGSHGKKHMNQVRWIKFRVGRLPCPADVTGDWVVDIDDVFAVLAAWSGGSHTGADVNQDGQVDIDDVFAVLAAWGPCP